MPYRNPSSSRHDTPLARTTPAPLNEGVRRNMQANRGRDTGPELALRRELHRRGRRFRVNRRPVPEVRSTADVVFGAARVAVYVDGCFWHSCPVHSVAPRNNAEWWREKLAATVKRDRRVTEELTSRGWTV